MSEITSHQTEQSHHIDESKISERFPFVPADRDPKVTPAEIDGKSIAVSDVLQKEMANNG